ncbi:MAG TPA: DinB family protein [Candidatus Eisenbacteria bacterium]|jgi:uncharacterized damage-inducible protein DinB
MTEVLRNFLDVLPGFRSREVSLFVAQMDDQSRRLREDLQGVSASELAWQPARGMNTIGMLLAHIAVVEVLWTTVGLLDETTERFEEVLGIGRDDDGIPLAAGSQPPTVLANRELAFYLDLLERTRAHTKAQTAHFTDADLDDVVRRRRPDRPDREFNKRWVLYHLLEHEAGHYGQILLLRHQYRAGLDPR